MDKEEMTKLGFTEESSWETEEQEKKYLFNKIMQYKENAVKSACKSYIKIKKNNLKNNKKIPIKM